MSFRHSCHGGMLPPEGAPLAQVCSLASFLLSPAPPWVFEANFIIEANVYEKVLITWDFLNTLVSDAFQVEGNTVANEISCFSLSVRCFSTAYGKPSAQPMNPVLILFLLLFPLSLKNNVHMSNENVQCSHFLW